MAKFLCQILSLCFFLSLFCNKTPAAQSIIKSLPGFNGALPFFLETGYAGVDKMEFFYYFIKSERDPENDPLILWLTGGPGCSSFSGLVYEIGPLKFNYADSIHSKPLLEFNPYAWTKVASIIFLDAPVGTGFSYATAWEAYNVSDTISASQAYNFLRKWLVDRPEFLANPLYIGGDSYSGMTVPLIVELIINGKEERLLPLMNLRGYLLGNPLTDHKIDVNSRVPFAYHMSLISKRIYESFRTNCKGEYASPDPNNALCLETIGTINQCIAKIDHSHILEPYCITNLSPRPSEFHPPDIIDFSFNDDIQLPLLHLPERWCRPHTLLYSYAWANDKNVQETLGIRQGTVKEWRRCNISLSKGYLKDVHSAISYHRNFTNTDLQVLIYSGDHDMIFPSVGTEQWIESLNVPIKSDWQPWFVDGQVAGYSVDYLQDTSSYRLTFATVKGTGHTPPEYKPKECLAMVDRWLTGYPL